MSHDARVQIEDSVNPGKGFSRNLNEFRGKEIEEEKDVRVCQCMCIPVFPGVQVLKRLCFSSSQSYRVAVHV